MSNELARSVSVYYKENGVLRPYDDKTSKSILAAAIKGHRIVKIRTRCEVSEFDLENMKHLKRGTGVEKDIYIEIPWSAKSLKAACSLKGDQSFRRKILEMAVDRIRETKSLNTILDLKAGPGNRLVYQNPYLGRGHSPYDNFVDSLLKATFTSDSVGELGWTLYDAVLEIASDGPTERNMRNIEAHGLRLVFHGTNEALMDSILKTGLLPQYRRSSVHDWFGDDIETSLQYTTQKTAGRVGTKVLFFMVLQAGVNSGYFTSGCNSFQLPLATTQILQVTRS